MPTKDARRKRLTSWQSVLIRKLMGTNESSGRRKTISTVSPARRDLGQPEPQRQEHAHAPLFQFLPANTVLNSYSSKLLITKPCAFITGFTCAASARSNSRAVFVSASVRAGNAVIKLIASFGFDSVAFTLRCTIAFESEQV
jgi:hypothetical protein